MGNSDIKLTAKEHRILITHWVGEAYQKLRDSKYDHLRYRCLQKTGCLITADGSNDSAISPERLNGYSVPPPLPTQPHIDPTLLPTPIAAPEPDDTCEAEIEEQDIPEENDEDLEVDDEKDCNFNHTLVVRRVKGLYDNGWFVGRICWFNNQMGKLRVVYDDDTDDYIDPDDIDGVELILIDENE